MYKWNIMIAVCLLVLVGCNKDEAYRVNNVAGLETAMVVHADGAIDPGNAGNPFDAVGLLHNEGLAALRSYKDASGDTTRDGKKSFLEKWYLEKTGADITLATYPKMERAIMSNYQKVLDNVMESDGGRKLMQALYRTLEKTPNVSMSSYHTFLKAVKDIEQKVKVADLSGYERGALLSMASMLRYSGHYWSTYLDEVKAPQNWSLKGIFSFLRKVGGFITGVAADTTVLVWHYVKNSPYDHMVLEAIWMSEICGYYTGWW